FRLLVPCFPLFVFMPSVITSFFLSSSSDPPHLHSFPTRRSSDLATKSVSELTSTTTPFLPEVSAPIRPSAATRPAFLAAFDRPRSEERRVGKERRSRGSAAQEESKGRRVGRGLVRAVCGAQ